MWDGYKTCVPLAITMSTTVMSTSTMEKGQRRWQISVGMNKLQQHTHNTTKQIDEDEDDIINRNVENYDTKDTAVRTEKARRMISCRNSFVGGLFSLLEIFLTIIILSVELLCFKCDDKLSEKTILLCDAGYCDPSRVELR